MYGIDLKDYDLKAQLAKCFDDNGSVYLAEHIPTNKFIAIKKFHVEKFREEFNMITEEAKLMREFDHPNILSYHTAFVHNLDLYFILPLSVFGSCRDMMNNYFITGLPEIIVSCVLRDVLQGVEYLHKKGYIHRSIRASHIFLNESNAVLGGIRDCTSILNEGKRVKNLHELPPNSKKSLIWLAPEVLAQNLLGYTEKSDIYSLGITIVELANGIEPFADVKTTFMLTQKMRGYHPLLWDFSTYLSEETTTAPPDSGVGESLASVEAKQIYSTRKLTDPFHKLAELCLTTEPNLRPNASSLMNHSFFKQCRHTTLKDQLNAFGIQIVDFQKIGRDEDLKLAEEFAEMNMETSPDWDFGSE